MAILDEIKQTKQYQNMLEENPVMEHFFEYIAQNLKRYPFDIEIIKNEEKGVSGFFFEQKIYSEGDKFQNDTISEILEKCRNIEYYAQKYLNGELTAEDIIKLKINDYVEVEIDERFLESTHDLVEDFIKEYPEYEEDYDDIVTVLQENDLGNIEVDTSDVVEVILDQELNVNFIITNHDEENIDLESISIELDTEDDGTPLSRLFDTDLDQEERDEAFQEFIQELEEDSDISSKNLSFLRLLTQNGVNLSVLKSVEEVEKHYSLIKSIQEENENKYACGSVLAVLEQVSFKDLIEITVKKALLALKEDPTNEPENAIELSGKAGFFSPQRGAGSIFGIESYGDVRFPLNEIEFQIDGERGQAWGVTVSDACYNNNEDWKHGVTVKIVTTKFGNAFKEFVEKEIAKPEYAETGIKEKVERLEVADKETYSRNATRTLNYYIRREEDRKRKTEELMERMRASAEKAKAEAEASIVEQPIGLKM